MGKNTKKTVRVFLKMIILGFLTSILFTGCDAISLVQSYFPQSENDVTADPESVEEPQTENDPTPMPTLSPIDHERILVWLPPQFDPQQESEGAQIFNTQVGNFQDIYPESSIEFRIKSESGLNAILDVLSVTSSAAPGALPTIVMLSVEDMRLAADQGLIQPIEFLTDELEEPDWYPVSKEMGTYNGETYGLPAALDALVMVSRNAYSSDTYFSLASMSQEPGEFGYKAGNSNTLVPYIWYSSSGAKWEDENGQLIFDEQQLTALFSALVVNRRTGSLTSEILDYQTEEQLWDAFSKKQINSIFTSYSATAQDQSENLVSHMPAMGEEPFTFADGWVWCLVQNDTTDTRLNIQFLEYMVSEVFLQEWTGAMRYLPARQGLDSLESDFQHQLLLSSHLPPDETYRDLSKEAFTGAIERVLKAETDLQTVVQDLINQLEKAHIE